MTHSMSEQESCQVCRRRSWIIYCLLSLSLLFSSASVFVLALASR
jgi:hypothetical protein